MNDWLTSEQYRVTRQLREGLTANACVALIGEYRMGKTWALQSLKDSLPPPCAYLSLAELADGDAKTLDERFYLRVLEGLAGQWQTKPPLEVPQALPDACKNSWERYDWFVDSLKKFATRSITLLIDDAHLLAGSAWGVQIFRRLPDLMNRVTNLRIAMAGTSQLELWAMGLERNTGRAGIWDLIRAPVILGPVSLQVIQDAFLDHQAVAQQLIQWCGGHPYCLRHMTGALPSSGILTSTMLQTFNDKMAQLRTEWDRTFRWYWQDYAPLARRMCFALTVLPDGATTHNLRKGLSEASAGEVDDALDMLNDTGIVYQDPTSKAWRLIGLFRQWYVGEIGYIADTWSMAQVDEGRPDAADESPRAAASTADRTRPTAETQSGDSTGRLTAGAIQRLKERLNELEIRHSTLTKRIKALDTDIGRTLEKLERDIRQELRNEWEQERNQVAEEMSSIESRLTPYANPDDRPTHEP